MASLRSLLSACLLSPMFHQVASAGEFSFLTFNVAGLPLPGNGIPGDKATNAETIGSKFAEHGYDVIQVQEDFNFHENLISTDNHPYLTETSGGAAFGSGLNTLSNYEFENLTRTEWNECSNLDYADCFTPKGFTAMTVQLEDGVYVDFYNVHADAGETDADFEARSDNIAQVAEYIEANSRDKAAVIGGDTNMLYAREIDAANIFIDLGFTDAWVELIRNGTAPAAGAATPPECANPATSITCETLDKVYYRGSSTIDIKATTFSYEPGKFLQPDGNILSDHNPVAVSFSWTQL